jgi:sugar phosphate isomerase/epimerase
MKLVMFSKNIDSLPNDEAGRQLKQMGFDGMDVTVRRSSGQLPAGRVLPEKVRKDLPALARSFREYGLEIPMISSGIQAAEDPFAEDVFKAAADVGASTIRLALWPYRGFGTFVSEMAAVAVRIDGIEKLAKSAHVRAVIHVHSGECMSSNPFMVWNWIKDRDPEAIGAYVDLEHITLETAPASRTMAFELLGRRINVIAVKDFAWEVQDRGPLSTKIVPRHVPIGQGVVPWKQVFDHLSRLGTNPIVSVHSEYLSSSWRILSVPELISQTTEDVRYLRSIMTS